MPILVQICVVVITIAIVALAGATVRVMLRLDVITQQLEGLATSLESIVPPVRTAANRLNQVVERTADLTNAVYDEVERPIRDTVAVLHGLRAGAESLVGALTRRNTHRDRSRGGNGHD